MGRRVAVEEPEPESEPDESNELDFAKLDQDEPFARVPQSKVYGRNDEAEIVNIIEGIVSRSPRKLHESLEKSERVGSRELSVIAHALDEEDTHIREAFDFAFIARRAAGRLKVQEAELVARVRQEAEEHAPRKLSAKGETKALTVDDIQSYYRSHPEVVAIRIKLVDYESFADRAARSGRKRSRRCLSRRVRQARARQAVTATTNKSEWWSRLMTSQEQPNGGR